MIFGKRNRLTDIDLSSVSLHTSRLGFDITGSFSDQLGYSVSSGGDVNRDGINDIIIGSSNAAYIILGKDTIDHTSGNYS